jgi:hypothetical protein
MPWRRQPPAPELPLDRDEVLAIIGALADLKAWTLRILRILREEYGEEGEDEP